MDVVKEAEDPEREDNSVFAGVANKKQFGQFGKTHLLLFSPFLKSTLLLTK